MAAAAEDRDHWRGILCTANPFYGGWHWTTHEFNYFLSFSSLVVFMYRPIDHTWSEINLFIQFIDVGEWTWPMTYVSQVWARYWCQNSGRRIAYSYCVQSTKISLDFYLLVAVSESFQFELPSIRREFATTESQMHPTTNFATRNATWRIWQKISTSLVDFLDLLHFLCIRYETTDGVFCHITLAHCYVVRDHIVSALDTLSACYR